MTPCGPENTLTPGAEGRVLKRSKEFLEGRNRDANHLAPVAPAEVVGRCWGNILSFTRLPEREFVVPALVSWWAREPAARGPVHMYRCFAYLM